MARMKLTPRQKAVCELLAQGFSDRRIAAKLSISMHGVRRHVENLFRRFEQRSRLGLAILFLEAKSGRIATGRNAIYRTPRRRAKVSL